MRTSLASAVLVGSLGSGSAQVPSLITREASVLDQRGKVIGSVTVRGSANATLLRIVIAASKLTPGWHGLQLHSVGDCSDFVQFARAKRAIDHVIKSHGLLHPDGPREGSLPNIYIREDGSAHAEVSSLSVRMLGQTGLIEGDGSALIIYEREDDQVSQPDGNAGNRVACTVLK